MRTPPYEGTAPTERRVQGSRLGAQTVKRTMVCSGERFMDGAVFANRDEFILVDPVGQLRMDGHGMELGKESLQDIGLGKGH